MANRTKKRTTTGLDASGRIDWDDWRNCIIAFWAERRFHGWFIAEQTGLTVGQVYARCRRYGIRLRDARDGAGADSEALTAMYSVGKISKARQRAILDSYPNPEAK